MAKARHDPEFEEELERASWNLVNRANLLRICVLSAMDGSIRVTPRLSAALTKNMKFAGAQLTEAARLLKGITDKS